MQKKVVNIKLGMLIFQVTRRCNQYCPHCCKGRMQNIDMTKEIIDNLFDDDEYQIKEMSHFVITGGEPTLVPDIVEYLVDKIIEKNINIINHVNIFTNGLIYSEQIIRSMSKLIDYLKSKDESKNVSINFKISNDQFHQNIPHDILEKYKKVDFVSENWLKPFVLSKNDIQNDGNAKLNNLGGNWDYTSIPHENFIIETNDEIIVKNGITISANGNVCSEGFGCASFDDEDKFAYGNLLEDTFLSIIKKFENYK